MPHPGSPADPTELASLQKFQENFIDQREWHDIFKLLNGKQKQNKTLQPKYPI